jgi:acetoin utilization deacetylase AcuC-like enzyme
LAVASVAVASSRNFAVRDMGLRSCDVQWQSSGFRARRAVEENVQMKVVYSEHMVADAQSFSPSARKPREVMTSWRRRFPLLEVIEPEPVTVEQICLAHDPDYVRGVLSLRVPNGFGNHLPEVAASLAWTSGAMLGAARMAFVEGCAAAPVSGFHHAGFAQGGGFCTFNGLLVAAMVLRKEQPHARIGILDFDQHYGNGSTDIIRELGLHWIEHYSAGAYWDQVEQAEPFLEEIASIMSRFGDCDLLLYQAGADPHVDDPLGGWLSTAQLRERDRRVFRSCRAMRLPVAWNLAGGYQTNLRKVLDIHDNTMLECLSAFITDSEQ